jgi:hypothetical protein
MNEQIKELAEQALKSSMVHDGMYRPEGYANGVSKVFADKFALLIVKECIDKIETHQIPVGNSAAGEMAYEWTYTALKEIRDEIKEHFGVEE